MTADDWIVFAWGFGCGFVLCAAFAAYLADRANGGARW
jgi:hypothetical protein